jgi:hypothetical protein
MNSLICKVEYHRCKFTCPNIFGPQRDSSPVEIY